MITQVVYIGKSVTVRGGYTPGFIAPGDPIAYLTTLDAGGKGRVVFITGQIAPTVQGLRIVGGNADGLGGIPDAPPRHRHGGGGGVYTVTATATFSNNWIPDERAGVKGG